MAWARGRGTGGWPMLGVLMCDVRLGRGLVVGTVSWPPQAPLPAAARRSSPLLRPAVPNGSVGGVLGLCFVGAAAWPACGGLW